MNNTKPCFSCAKVKKNSDPATLDGTNIGDSAVVKLPDGASQSAKIETVTPDSAVFVWRTGPYAADIRKYTVARAEWPRVVTLFGNATFMAL